MKNLFLTPSTPSLTSDVVLADTTDTVTGSVYANQPGTLHVEQSGDNVNWDVDDTVAVVASTINQKINFPILLPYVRIRFVATGAAATTLRIFARLTSSGVKP